MQANQQDPSGGYSVRRVKTFKGCEGCAFNATLCKDGAPVADVIDHGDGSCCYFSWRGAPETRNAMKAELAAFIKTLPPDTTYGKPLPVDADMFVTRLVDTFSTLAKLRRRVKKGVVMVDKGKLYTMTVRAGGTLADAIGSTRKRFPNATILNELPENEWLALISA